jgi:hypothetical protein
MIFILPLFRTYAVFGLLARLPLTGRAIRSALGLTRPLASASPSNTDNQLRVRRQGVPASDPDPLRQSFLSSARARVRLKYFAPSLEHSLTRLQAQAENRRSIDVRKADFPVIRVVDIDHYHTAGGW